MPENSGESSRVGFYLDDLLEESTGLERSEGLEELERKDEISQILYALSNQDRITVFHEIGKGKRLTDIKEDVDVAGSTVHNYANDLIDQELVEKSRGKYSLTWKGQKVLTILENLELILFLDDLRETFDALPISAQEELVEQVLSSEDLGLEQISQLGISRDEVKNAVLNAAIEDEV